VKTIFGFPKCKKISVFVFLTRINIARFNLVQIYIIFIIYAFNQQIILISVKLSYRSSLKEYGEMDFSDLIFLGY